MKINKCICLKWSRLPAEFTFENIFSLVPLNRKISPAEKLSNFYADGAPCCSWKHKLSIHRAHLLFLYIQNGDGNEFRMIWKLVGTELVKAQWKVESWKVPVGKTW